MATKYIFITGGVVSSLGKGVAASSVGAILESRGFSVTLMKFDPYINVDPGTMSPYQHGEVFVTDDGAETDLDLGQRAQDQAAPAFGARAARDRHLGRYRPLPGRPGAARGHEAEDRPLLQRRSEPGDRGARRLDDLRSAAHVLPGRARRHHPRAPPPSPLRERHGALGDAGLAGQASASPGARGDRRQVRRAPRRLQEP